MQDQPVDEGQEKADGLAALLVAPDPRDLVTPQVPLGDSRARPGQLAVPQDSVAVQLLDALQDAVAHYLAQEVVQVTEADLVQTGHDVLQGDFLQIKPHDVSQGHLALRVELRDPQRVLRVSDLRVRTAETRLVWPGAQLPAADWVPEPAQRQGEGKLARNSGKRGSSSGTSETCGELRDRAPD